MIYPSTMAHAMQPGLSVAEAAWRRQVGAPPLPLPPLAAAAAVSGSAAAAAPPAAAAAAAAAAPPSFRLGGRGGAASLGAGRRLGPGVVARASAAAAATVHSPVSAWALPTAADSGSSRSSSSRSRGPALGWGLAGGCVGAGNGARAVVAAAARRRGGGGDGGAAAVVAEPIAERIEDTELYDETYKSYLTYAMSVIVSRAIPDVRDGLKPVHRRILYAMHELGLVHNKPFKKCARVVGEVLGKFHPHGDTAVYDSLVRMAQPFAMRSPLVDGHGNFGSLDDDPAAAMRYTECRLTRAAGEALLRDLGPDTVDWQPTFDESQMEPLVLPAVVPNLLVNGSSGIAVGLASNIPPHNLGEVVAALRALIADPRVTTEQLMQHVRGPDFPTGGELVAGPELLQAYATGRGSVVLRGKAFIERQGGGGGGGHDAAAAAAGGRGRRRTAAAAAAGVGAAEDASAAGGAAAASGGKEQIVITELPYQVFKSDLVAAIAELIESKQLEGASDVRDESDRTGVRVVVEVKRGHSGEVVLAQLYKSTKLQINFNYNCMALLQTKPRQMGLKDMLQAFLDFRCDVVSRRSSASLHSARTRLHLVDGFLRLLREPGRLDAVVADVRAAADGPAARAALVAGHGLSEEQAEAILGLTLRRLTGLEADKLEQERAELHQSIARLEGILADRTALLSVVEQEAAALAAAYPDPRRTALVAADDLPSAPSLESLLPARPCLLLASRRGFLRRLPDESLAAQNRNTRGKSGIRLRSGDSLVGLAAATERDVVLLLTPGGKMFKTRAAHVPASSSSSSSSQSASPGAAAAGPSGTSVANILKIPQSFPVAALVPVPPGLMPPPPAGSTRRRKAAGAAANGDGAGDDDGGGAAEEAEARDGEEEGEDEEQENVEEEGEEEEEDGAAAAAGPCLVLCSRRGLIKRVVLKSRRDSRKGLTVMGLKSGAADEPTTTAAAAEADDADGVAGASGKKRGPRSRSAGGGSGAAPEELGWAALSGSPDDVVALVTAEGHALLFPASDLRPSGPQSGGSLAMRTSRRRPNDRIAAMTVLPADLAPLLGAPLKRAAAGGGGNGGDGEDGAAGGEDDDEVDEQEEEEPGQESEEGAASSASPQQPDAARGPAGPCLLLVTAYGLGKRIPLSHLRLGTRRQSGIVAIRVATADRARKVRGGGGSGGGSGGGATAAAAAVTRGSDRVVAALVVRDGQEVVMASRNGVVVRQSVDGIAVQGRMTRGTFVMQLDDGDEVVDVVAAASTPLEVAAAAPPPPPPPAAAAVGRGRGRRKAPASADAAQ